MRNLFRFFHYASFRVSRTESCAVVLLTSLSTFRPASLSSLELQYIDGPTTCAWKLEASRHSRHSSQPPLERLRTISEIFTCCLPLIWPTHRCWSLIATIGFRSSSGLRIYGVGTAHHMPHPFTPFQRLHSHSFGSSTPYKLTRGSSALTVYPPLHTSLKAFPPLLCL